MSEQNKAPQIRKLKDQEVQPEPTTTTGVPDGLPKNAETVLGRFPAEPFNAVSNLAFLAIIVYWTWKTRFRIRLYPAIVLVMPLMLGAFIAGTMHHILRSGKVWHSLVLFCIFFAVLNTCIYLWYRVTDSWLKSFLCVLAVPLIFRIFLATISLPEKISIASVFVVMAMAIMIPAVIHCIKNHLKNLELLIISSLTFVIGLVFRETDHNLAGIMPVGTHFLWHIFGTISVFFLLKYLFITDKTKSKKVFAELASSFKSQ